MKKLIPKYLQGNVLSPKDYFSEYLQSKGVSRIINNAYKWMDNYYSNPWNRFLSKVGIKDNSNYGGINRYKELIPKAGFALDNSIYYYTSGSPYTTLESSKTPHHKVHSNPNWSDASDYGATRKWDTDYADAHEYGHVFTNELPITRPTTELLNSISTYIPGNAHDSRLDEKWADLEALRYQLYKNGIYDSRSNKNITPLLIQKMRDVNIKKDPNIFDRLLESESSNEKIAEMLNAIVRKGDTQTNYI